MRDICLIQNPELLNPNIKLNDAKKIIKKITGISEDNQRCRKSFFQTHLMNYFGVTQDSKYAIFRIIRLKSKENIMKRKSI